ncbi:MAG: coenzyme F420-0:L-glutamate ligase [Patescibacteria group bacterium]
MKITAIKTKKIVPNGDNLLAVLDAHLPPLRERTVVVITSKIAAICEGRVVRIGDAEKADLIAREADYYLPSEESKYNITLAIKNGMLVPTAGIDESNGNGFYILWPEDPQRTANEARGHLSRKHSLTHLGVILTDSTTAPLRWGTRGVSIAASGIKPLNDYIGKPDIFGRELKVTKANIVDGLAAAAVAVMGEGDEQTPLAVIEDIPFVVFQGRNPTEAELQELRIAIEEDLYASLLRGAKWKKGGGGQGNMP